MPDQILTRWIDRRWSFDFPAELYPCAIERLRGLPARAAEIATTLTPNERRVRARNGWSIVRHLAHLIDLEALLDRRLDAYEAGLPVLPGADMTNARTVEADHDARTPEDVGAELRRVRMTTVARLEAYPPDFFARAAFHERLGIDKRLVDTCFFFADHDDHHLALIAHLRLGAAE
jgi:hypothetical protein